MAGFIYEKPFQIQKDPTKYRLLTKDYIKTIECDGRKILKVEPQALELLAREAVSDISFYLRTAHLEKLSKILDDPEFRYFREGRSSMVPGYRNSHCYRKKRRVSVDRC